MIGLKCFKTARNAAVFHLICVLLLINLFSYSIVNGLKVTFDPHDLQFQVGDTGQFFISLSSPPNTTVQLALIEDKEDLVTLSASNFSYYENASETYNVSVKGQNPGSLTIWANASVQDYDTNDAFVRIKIKVHSYLDIVSDIIGWMYFVAWSVSFYPQIYLNFKRRSVIGYNLDFLSLNIVGFFCYSMFNCGLYFNREIQSEYFKLHPRGVNPVQLNDVVFAIHAFFACLVAVCQSIVFERGDQRVSRICIILLSIATIFIGICLILSIVNVITWLTYLYYFSYVKLTITTIKYMPQAYFNFVRKSTLGWSIGGILLDFTGGILSVLQMFIIAYNYDDWSSLFGDPTKLLLGLISMPFDVLFMVQHYCLYRHSSSKALSPYKIMSPSTSVQDIVRDPNEHYPYQEEPDNNDNV